ncbi:hypothetical protein [Gloeobacter kilaueensis]|uniref:Uncharacterized protein n=1 Tax=Gloeobacter kilaueensis (strain ATCC BAA-2537 / CCAP 1431/1 / ULC 316 / JS1) TaxID=1183438 RepID=U5QGR8_GLOK1|nr:hypothetical protein [Gloeobacter kilaueensis]AGY58088.1 hypothetical protein GKIL_1842 [Gloeobacter kilaueensis JS1]
MSEKMHADRIEGAGEPYPDQLSRCDELDVLESAITLHQKLRLQLKDFHEQIVVEPVDLVTHDGTEFLHYKMGDRQETLDVNRIHAVEVVQD